MLELAKHQAGTPLSDAEHRQRVNAARARWLAAGAATGAVAGAIHGVYREGNRFGARAAMEGLRIAQGIDRANRGLDAERGQRSAAIQRAVAFRLRAKPETAAESKARRHRELMGEAPRPSAAPPSNPPVVGDIDNPAQVYDYAIDRQKRQLKPTLFRLRQLEAKEAKAFEDPAAPQLTVEESRLLRELKTQAAAGQRQLKRLQDLLARVPTTIGRAGSTQRRGQKQVEISATAERKFRGGETQTKIKRRVSEAKEFERERQKRILGALDRRTEVLRPVRQRAVLNEEAKAIQEAFERGEYGSSILRAAGKHSLVGAGLGLTAVGLGILAHHLVHAYRRRQPLEKAARRTQAEDMAANLAAVYRRWIDRLLGKTEESMNLGDGIAEALAPGIAESYVQGATEPPIDPEDSDPRYLIQTDFDLMNPAIRRHMAEYALDRIVDITQQQREAIRQALMTHSVLGGQNPKDTARVIRQSIGLTPYQQAVVQGFRSQLVALDPRVLSRKLRDARYDRTIQKAIDTNTPLSDEQIDAMTDAYHRRMLALRAQTIARTEAIRANSYGSLARAQEVLDLHPELDVIKRWIATDDERTRDTHRDLDGKEVQGMLTHFITSHGNMIRWPLDDRAVADEVINCRCSLGYRFIPRRGQLQAAAV